MDARELGTIQGKSPDSKNEWFVAQALAKLEVRFKYKVIIDGGNLLRGGQILDFLVYTPFRTAVPVHGERWHEGELDDVENYKMQRLKDIYGRNRVIVLWGRETDTYEKALAAVEEKVL